MQQRRNIIDKNQIISEYLTSKCRFLDLEAKYGVNRRTIQTWVRKYRLSTKQTVSQPASDVQQLKKQLEQEKMKNELLQEMLHLSEQHTGLDLRKKFGTKQS